MRFMRFDNATILKLFLGFYLVLVLSFSLVAQEQFKTNGNQYFYENNSGWFHVNEGQELAVEQLMEDYQTELGLTPKDEMRLFKSETDEIGIEHKKFQQYHLNIPVDGAIFLSHEKDGKLKSFNGRWSNGMDEVVKTTISPEMAVARALEYFPAQKYYWEDEGAEQMLCAISNCSKETFFPDPQLVWFNPDDILSCTGMQLCYKMDIQASKPLFWEQVYIDASTGELVEHYHFLCGADVHGVANTKFGGEQDIVTDSIGPGMYRLQETGRGGGIMTLNMQGATNYGEAIDFMDEDNYWDNFNENIDEAATDAHWSAEMTFDYMLEKHNYLGVDGEGMPLINYVHFDVNYTNAFWNGAWATFGDGGSAWNPLTSIDIVAHEFAHGITGNTARLVYRDESGALNESFSDIIGAAVEFWALPDSSDWLMGEASELDGTGFRNMADPKERNDPSTYLGENWVTGEQDNGGVHTNSSIQNLWYVLLTDGGSGENDNGLVYEVEGIGIDAATAIAFRNLKYYLSVESTYLDARNGSLQAADDLYGYCSNEYVQTAKAWDAVGLGNVIRENDVRLSEISYPAENNCGLTDSEFPLIELRYSACNVVIPANSLIPIAFQVDGGDIVNDTITLTEDLVGGQTLQFQTAKPITGLEVFGTHELKIWVTYDQDPNPANDGITLMVINEIEQNTDFGIADVNEPTSDCFMGEDFVSVDIIFDGCDSIAAGTELQIYYAINGEQPVMENYTLPTALYANEKQTFQFPESVDFARRKGVINVVSWVIFEDDFLTENDSLDSYVFTHPVLMSEGDYISFEFQDESLDSLYTFTSRDSDVYTSFTAASDGFKGLQMTGGDALTNRAELRRPNDLNKWEINESFIAKVCFCVDASDEEGLFMSFDMRQSYSIAYNTIIFERDVPLASSLRLLADGEQISETFHPETYFGDPFIRYDFDLSAYIGGSVEMCFETRNILSPLFDDIGVGDNAYIDNIELKRGVVSTKNLRDKNDLKVYPNPVKESLFVEINEVWKQDVQVEIYDPIGQKVKQMILSKNSNGDVMEISMNDLPQGMYRLLFTDGYTKRFANFVKF